MNEERAALGLLLAMAREEATEAEAEFQRAWRRRVQAVKALVDEAVEAQVKARLALEWLEEIEKRLAEVEGDAG